jgi:hypothetical protein
MMRRKFFSVMSSAATSLREGLAEMFTVTKLNLSASLARCLVSTNVIESPHSGLRLRTREAEDDEPETFLPDAALM